MISFSSLSKCAMIFTRPAMIMEVENGSLQYDRFISFSVMFNWTMIMGERLSTCYTYSSKHRAQNNMCLTARPRPFLSLRRFLLSARYTHSLCWNSRSPTRIVSVWATGKGKWHMRFSCHGVTLKLDPLIIWWRLAVLFRCVTNRNHEVSLRKRTFTKLTFLLGEVDHVPLMFGNPPKYLGNVHHEFATMKGGKAKIERLNKWHLTHVDGRSGVSFCEVLRRAVIFSVVTCGENGCHKTECRH